MNREPDMSGDKVYRLFASPEELQVFLRGRWMGKGIHGIPEVSFVEDSLLRLKSGYKGNRFKIRGSFSLILRYILKTAGFQTSSVHKDPYPSRILKIGHDGWKVSEDTACYTDALWDISLQGLTEKKCYVVIKSLKENVRIHFAGSLVKIRFFG